MSDRAHVCKAVNLSLIQSHCILHMQLCWINSISGPGSTHISLPACLPVWQPATPASIPCSELFPIMSKWTWFPLRSGNMLKFYKWPLSTLQPMIADTFVQVCVYVPPRSFSVKMYASSLFATYFSWTEHLHLLNSSLSFFCRIKTSLT